MENNYTREALELKPKLNNKFTLVSNKNYESKLNLFVLKMIYKLSLFFSGRLYISFENKFYNRLSIKMCIYIKKIINIFFLIYCGRLHVSLKNHSTKKPIIFKIHNDHIVLKIKKRYIFASVALIAVISFANAYYINQKNNNLITSEQKIQEITKSKEQLQSELSKLKTENKDYKENLSDLEEKAQEIENKLNELNDVKTDIYNKLDDISSKNNFLQTTAYAFDMQDNHTISLENNEIINAPKTEKLENILKNLETIVKNEEVEYIDVSKTINETLSYIQKTPSIWPVNGPITSGFGSRKDPIAGFSDYHPAIDIRVDEGTPVKATADGTVVVSEFNNGGYGYMVKINHGNGYKTLYAHNSKLVAKIGDYVKKGDVIAYSGSTGRVTGPHVHYEVILNDEQQNPMDYLN